MPFLEQSLEKRLKDNYSCNKEPGLTKEISRILIGNPEPPYYATVRELDLLTRNVENSLFFEGYIPGVIETAYDYCVRGIEMVDSCDDLFGSFNSRARTFLRNLAELSEPSGEKKKYLENALAHADNACDFYKSKKPLYYGKALSARGEIKSWLAVFAKDEMRLSDAVSFFIDSAKDKILSALVVENTEKSYAFRRYVFAANREYDAALLSSEFKIDLLMDAVRHTKKSLSLSDDEKSVASSQLNIGKFNKLLFESTENTDFLGEAIHFYGLADSYFSKFSDEENRKTSTAINACLHNLKLKAREIQRYVPEKRNKKRLMKKENVRKIIEQEIDELG